MACLLFVLLCPFLSPFPSRYLFCMCLLGTCGACWHVVTSAVSKFMLPTPLPVLLAHISLPCQKKSAVFMHMEMYFIYIKSFFTFHASTWKYHFHFTRPIDIFACIFMYVCVSLRWTIARIPYTPIHAGGMLPLLSCFSCLLLFMRLYLWPPRELFSYFASVCIFSVRSDTLAKNSIILSQNLLRIVDLAFRIPNHMSVYLSSMCL